MGSFGERLRREREMRGITIEEIAEATKIGSRNLRALEEEKFDLLPGGIFNKGFVRAFAKYLGLDEEQAVADYIAAETSFREASAEGPLQPVAAAPSSSYAVPATIVLIIAIAAGGFFGWRYYQKREAARPVAVSDSPVKPAEAAPAQPPATSAPAPTDAAAAATQPAATSPAATTPTTTPTDTAAIPPAPSADGFVVQLKARQDSWVSAKADGKSLFSETLKASNERTVRAKDRIILTLGNAGGVQVSYNGKDLNLGNVAGQVKTLIFTPQGLQPEAPEQRQ